MRLILFPIAAVLLALSPPVFAQQQGQPEPRSDMTRSMADHTMNALQQDEMAAMEKMNKAMMEGMMDPNPAMAWMKSMAAHHQGAIDMSKVVLRHIKDAEVAKEANKTIQDNETALKELQTTLVKEGNRR
ncbi:MAG: DUF305 domain-containing protein [Rhodopseudomonas palustris]|uniref:DUF305 domain-containing protein n=1 Tax=Rhodopseudomonas palustris TaxID=1076 RepID=A0A933RUJ2_RHOPL|nr:DUF305 domain-containing protein [Rhodopseudomonas palustris]